MVLCSIGLVVFCSRVRLLAFLVLSIMPSSVVTTTSPLISAVSATSLAWIEYAFQLAQKKSAAGIVFAFQADMFYSPPGVVNNQNSGFVDTLNQFRSLAEKTTLPILLIHGDSHHLRIDQPLLDSSRRVLENVYRLEVMGADEVQAVEVTVDDSKSSPFSFRPLLVPENLNPQ